MEGGHRPPCINDIISFYGFSCANNGKGAPPSMYTSIVLLPVGHVNDRRRASPTGARDVLESRLRHGDMRRP
eukprot:9145229-Pyramimonas_sp.AAC.1